MDLTKIKITNNLAEWIDQHKPSQEIVNRLMWSIDQYMQQIAERFTEGPVEMMKGLYEFMDEQEKEVPATQKRAISCSKGCSACCNVRVDVTDYEAATIAEYLKENGMTFSKARAEVQAGMTKDEWMISHDRPCVFLKAGECSIYIVRPMACRKYFVTSDPKFCDAHLLPKAGVSVYLNMDMELMASALYSFANHYDSLPGMMLPYHETERNTDNICYVCGDHTEYDCKGCNEPVCDNCTVSTGNPENPDFVYCQQCATNIQTEKPAD